MQSRPVYSDGDLLPVQESRFGYLIMGRLLPVDTILEVWQPYSNIEPVSLNLSSLMIDWILTKEREYGIDKAVKWDRYLECEYPDDTEYSLQEEQ
jgi:hypothetical protein